ncbi:MAG: AtpZ/AtpI family protein [Bernardetiaceae bacterium]|jgi:F0F1-type ATP synthase assembly protein I|nr:AtpZ/AtpI family protein [Bernardetiaceae bacterium]
MSTPPKPPSRKPLNPYLKYSGLAFELAGAILLGWWLGQWVDRWLATAQPYGVLAGILLFLGAALARIIYSLTREP